MIKPLYNQSGFILPILVFVAIIVLVQAGYLYLKSPEIEKPAFIRQMEEKDVRLNRKVLSELAMNHPAAFDAVVKAVMN